MTAIIALFTIMLLAAAGVCAGFGARLAAGPKGSAIFPVIGAIAGLGLGIVNYSVIRKGEADARRGWNLVPIVIAAVDIKPGEVLTFDMISQRSIPEQFVSRAYVLPGEVQINLRVAAPMQAGDPLFWDLLCDVTPAPGRTP